MSFAEIAKKRYSVRSYKDATVEREKILQILEAVRMAPSACNFQPVHFVVMTEKERVLQAAATFRADWLKDAPVLIAVCGDHSASWKRKDSKDHCDVDAAIAIDHLTLAAADLGLGTCWICAFDAQKCHEILQLPDHLEVIALIPLGYPNGEPPVEKPRKSLDQLVSWETYIS